MVHQFHKGRQGEGQHVSKAGKHRRREGDGPRSSAQGEAGVRESFRKDEYKQNCTRSLGLSSWATDNTSYTRGSVGRRQVASQ